MREGVTGMIYVLLILRYIAYTIVATALIYGFWHEKNVVAWEEKIRRKLDEKIRLARRGS